MNGKLILILVLGLVVSTATINFTLRKNTPTSATAANFYRSMAKDIAISGANLVSNKIYFDRTWTGGTLYNDIDFNEGKLNVEVVGNPLNSTVDVICRGTFPKYGSDQKTVEIRMGLGIGYFDNFALLTDIDSKSWLWVPGERADGDVHSNTTIYHRYGSPDPIFKGRVTSGQGFDYDEYDNGKISNPKYTYPPESGIYHKLPTSFASAAYTPNIIMPQSVKAATGSDQITYRYSGSNYMQSKNQVHLQFFVDGGVQKIRYFTGARKGNYAQYPSYRSEWYGDFKSTDVVITAPADGVLRFKDADVFVEGTIKNKFSIISEKSTTGGNIILTDDVKTYSDPKNPACSDYIGLLASENVMIGNTEKIDHKNPYWNTTKRYDNPGGELRIDATIVALNGGLTSMDNQPDGSNRGRSRNALSVYGSITQKEKKGNGWGNFAFWKNYSYDPRLKTSHANGVPQTDSKVYNYYLVKTVYN